MPIDRQRRSAACGLAVLMLAAAVPAARAQAGFPAKPVKIIVPFTPGGGNDAFARQIGQMLSESWKQQVIIDNRPGAGGNIGTAAAARSAPDGYTLLLGHTGTLAINPGLYGANLPYDPLKDFEPVSMVASTPLVLAVHPGVKAAHLTELIALAKARPGEINYASSGSGTGSHLSGEMFARMAGIRLTHIPYKGTAPATTDLLGGQVQMSFGVIPGLLQHIQSGKLRPIAVTGRSRSPLLPNVPTMAEAGLPGYESTLTYGILAPKGTPQPVVREIHGQIARALTSERLRASLSAEGAVPVTGSPADFGATMRSEIEKWGKVIREGNIRAD
ncbi:Tripartite-type tricarboxylate transporter, receptor component TctC [Noviherbaspirillum humi]|uniref:Tripartite-type tricarboxylate transporter, receptor component TctC n=1 Tax=Noviherbaspirillum humi TaxID=1688639 RepID=A0A239K1D9_9BURK|nr:tripartite tricarboxylate transporter substrate binding protein [Noviherbaspirillum humi]SNT11512.1 Tripartite-type tricarboxylate transporter, receptor component TctC [Noviherbaspirillum humi]